MTPTRSRRLRVLLGATAVIVVTCIAASSFGQSKGCSVPTLYEHKNQGGRSVRITGRIENLKDFGMGDEASYVCVPPGWHLTVWIHAHFEGSKQKTFGPGTRTTLGSGWEDEISSAIAMKESNPKPDPEPNPKPDPEPKPKPDPEPEPSSDVMPPAPPPPAPPPPSNGGNLIAIITAVGVLLGGIGGLAAWKRSRS